MNDEFRNALIEKYHPNRIRFRHMPNRRLSLDTSCMDRKRDEIYADLGKVLFFDHKLPHAYFYASDDSGVHFVVRNAYGSKPWDKFDELFGYAPLFLCIDGALTYVPMFDTEANYKMWLAFCHSNLSSSFLRKQSQTSNLFAFILPDFNDALKA